MFAIIGHEKFVVRDHPFSTYALRGEGGQATVVRLCYVRRGEGGLNCLCTKYALNGWPHISKTGHTRAI